MSEKSAITFAQGCIPGLSVIIKRQIYDYFLKKLSLSCLILDDIFSLYIYPNGPEQGQFACYGLLIISVSIRNLIKSM